MSGSVFVGYSIKLTTSSTNRNATLVMICVFVPELLMAQRKFAQCLGEFKFEYIGDAKTDDEKYIGSLTPRLMETHQRKKSFCVHLCNQNLFYSVRQDGGWV